MIDPEGANQGFARAAYRLPTELALKMLPCHLAEVNA